MEALALAILAAAALIAAVFGGVQQKRKPGGSRAKWTPRTISSNTPQERPRDSADQLRIVMRSPFQKQRLMSKGEYDVFRTVEAHLRHCGPGFRLMAQPSMGEFLQTPDKDAYLSINSKRVDMLVIDTFGMPVVAIEHQGSGHHQGDAAARDAVKREALRRAGIEFVEIYDYHRPEDICRLIGESIARNKPPASPSAIPPRQASA